MAARYYKYRKDFNNTIVASGTTSLSLGFNETEIYLDAPIITSPLYKYRYDTDTNTIVSNPSGSSDHYLKYSILLEKINTSVSNTDGALNNIVVSGTTTLSGISDETQNITYGTPAASIIPTLNLTFTSIQILGSVSVPLSTVTGWNINWSSTANQLYTFAFNTSNGVPAFYKNLLGNTTAYMNIANPYIRISGSGISNLDDDYWVNFINGSDFVLVSKTRELTIYLSTSINTYIPKTFGTTLMGIDSQDKVYDTGIPSTLYGSEFNYAVSTGVSTTTSTSAQVKVDLLTNDLPLGVYEISANWGWSHNSESNSARFDLVLNSVRIGQQLELEPKDVLNIGTEYKVVYMVLSGVKRIQLRYWNEGGSTSIYDASVKLIRVK